jgi:hypothetical protein
MNTKKAARERRPFALGMLPKTPFSGNDKMLGWTDAGTESISTNNATAEGVI